MVQRFRSLLNLCLSRGALRLRLTSGLAAELSISETVTHKEQDGLFSEVEILEIMKAVLPGQNFEASPVLLGSLNVGPQGILKLRALRNPLRLDVYTPSGEALFAQDCATPVAPLASSVPLVPLAPSATPQSIPQIPVPIAMPRQPSTAQSSPAGDVEGDDLMFRTSLQVRKKQVVDESALSPLTDSMPVHVRMSAPPLTSTQSIAAEAVEINFASSEKSDGSFSNGSNPIDKLLREMVQLKASDMHLTVGQPIVFRVHGEITRVGDEKITAAMMEALVLPTMALRNRKEFFNTSDTDLAYELGGTGRFRVNVFRDHNGVGAVLRHIPSQILTAEQLGLSPAITKLCTLSKGLVLVTGPTGSGKSTTLAAMLDLINKTRKEHIVTIEDPIEFLHPQQLCLVNQREVHKHTGSFARALKAALREDPDVVLIGEMRDLETVAIAIETAETGHLVFGTLHTTTAMSTVDRIIDQFPADRQSQIRTMLASSLRGVVAQTLLKKKSGGRVAAHEVLITNDAVSAMIREGKIQHLANHMLTQKADGNQLLNDALIKLVQDGVVDPQDAFFKAVDKGSFLAAAKSKGINIAA